MELIIQPQRPAKNIGVAPEEPLPTPEAQHRDQVRFAGRTNVRTLNRTAKQRRHAQEIERIGREPNAPNRFRSEFARQQHASRTGRHDIGQARQPGHFDIFVQPIRAHLLVGFGADNARRPDFLRLGVGVRADQHAVDDTEERRRRPDTERQGKHGNSREPGLFQQHAEAVAQVIHICDLRFAISDCRFTKTKPEGPSIPNLQLPTSPGEVSPLERGIQSVFRVCSLLLEAFLEFGAWFLELSSDSRSHLACHRSYGGDEVHNLRKIKGSVGSITEMDAAFHVRPWDLAVPRMGLVV